MTQPELHQCPCSPKTRCIMDEPCLGCEKYSEWEQLAFEKMAERKRYDYEWNKTTQLVRKFIKKYSGEFNECSNK